MDLPRPESLREQSQAERAAGNLMRADALAREAVEFDWKQGDRRALWLDLGHLAAIAVDRREFDRAATLLAAADTLVTDIGPSEAGNDAEATRAMLAAAMDPAELERAQRSGRAMSAADAAGFALGSALPGEGCS